LFVHIYYNNKCEKYIILIFLVLSVKSKTFFLDDENHQTEKLFAKSKKNSKKSELKKLNSKKYELKKTELKKSKLKKNEEIQNKQNSIPKKQIKDKKIMRDLRFLQDESLDTKNAFVLNVLMSDKSISNTKKCEKICELLLDREFSFSFDSVDVFSTTNIFSSSVNRSLFYSIFFFLMENLEDDMKIIILNNIIERDIIPIRNIYNFGIFQSDLIPLFIRYGMNPNMIIHTKYPLGFPVNQVILGCYDTFADFQKNVGDSIETFEYGFDNYYTTPLLWYIHKNNLEVVNFLLEHGADVNLPGYKNITPLNYAAKIGNLSIFQTILEYFPETILDYKNRTPLMRAVVNHHSEIAKILITYDESVISQRNVFGMNILMISIENLWQNLEFHSEILNLCLNVYPSHFILDKDDEKKFNNFFQEKWDCTIQVENLTLIEHIFVHLYLGNLRYLSNLKCKCKKLNTPIPECVLALQQYLLSQIFNETLIKELLIFHAGLNNDIEVFDILLSRCSDTRNINVIWNSLEILDPKNQSTEMIHRLIPLCTPENIASALFNSLYHDLSKIDIQQFINNLEILYSQIPGLNLFRDVIKNDEHKDIIFMNFTNFFVKTDFNPRLAQIFCQNMSNEEISLIFEYILSFITVRRLLEIDIAVFEFFLNHMFDINKLYIDTDIDGNTFTLSMYFVKHFPMKYLELILKYNPDLYFRDNTGRHTISYCSQDQIRYIFSVHVNIPEIFRDPISLELLEDPHIASDSITYSYESLRRIFQTNKISPLTREPLARLSGKYGIPNIALRSMIDDFKDGKLKFLS